MEKQVMLEVNHTISISELKEKIAKELQIPVANQQLLIRRKFLQYIIFLNSNLEGELKFGSLKNNGVIPGTTIMLKHSFPNIRIILCYGEMMDQQTGLNINSTASIRDLKKKVAERLQIPMANQHLLFNGKLVKSGSLADNGIGSKALITVKRIEKETSMINLVCNFIIDHIFWIFQLFSDLSRYFDSSNVRSEHRYSQQNSSSVTDLVISNESGLFKYAKY